DCFYAAVHMRDDPTLAGRPVVIGGRPESRGVVAAASYEARSFGIRSAMSAARAHALCPDAVFLPPDFGRYRRESEAIQAIFRDFTPYVQVVSIDEAFLDVSAHLEPWGSATAVAEAIRQRVRAERRLTVSVGVGPSRLVAKIASDFKKPDGLTVVPPRKVQAFLDPLPVRRLPGVGPATEERLVALGLETVAQLRAVPEEDLVRRFGKHGRQLATYARGIDGRPLELDGRRKSFSSEETYPRDLRLLGELHEALDRLATDVATGLRKRDLAACTLSVKVRYSDFTTVTRSQTLPAPTADLGTIAAWARELLGRTDGGRRPVRLLGVGASNLVAGDLEQLALFSG
ncbi:MAG: DNA polymerase IV, partial [Thermoanaerobaculia bacterium]